MSVKFIKRQRTIYILPVCGNNIFNQLKKKFADNFENALRSVFFLSKRQAFKSNQVKTVLEVSRDKFNLVVSNYRTFKNTLCLTKAQKVGGIKF